jgi:hypothetical protein
MKAMKSNPRNNPSIPSDGSRDEGSSVLFSLEALVAKAEGASGTAHETSKNGSDDSGLIDLRAMEAAAQNAAPAPAPLLPIFPFGAPEVIEAPAQNPSQTTGQAEQANGKSRKGRWIAASLVAVAISAVAIGVASAGPNVEPMKLGGGFSPVFQDVAKRTLKAIPPPVEADTKENGAQANAKETAATSKSPARTARNPVTNTQTKKPEPTKVVDPPKPTTPPLDQCDLMCQMRRRAGK